ncbi:MAG: hypothetical protein LPK19_17570 [Hymenobacteraceae bacterium]|nr:hypothetical protein [Hymenobacteraceae bacterium]MDX5398065.1 hypothetical protein [Hymenobacteraceae bacterium]MDX5514136.1 hypothetical protein [Hymenobacteraceae bacterium]
MTRIAAPLFLFLLIVLSTVAFSLNNSLNYFQAGFEGADIKLEWEMGHENGLSRFDVYRKAESETSYKKITTVLPNGARRYVIMDTDLYKSNTTAGSISYRLTVWSNSGDMSYYANVTQTPSAVQRSWGSIKSMFR